MEPIRSIRPPMLLLLLYILLNTLKVYLFDENTKQGKYYTFELFDIIQSITFLKDYLIVQTKNVYSILFYLQNFNGSLLDNSI